MMTHIENFEPYKLVVSDIDGTIKCFSHPISDYTKNVVKEIRLHGLLFSLATGRSLPTAKIFAEELDVALPLVLSNGCIVQKLTGEVLHHAELPVEVTQKVMGIADELNVRLVLFADDQVYFKQAKGNHEIPFNPLTASHHEFFEWSEVMHHLPLINKCVALERTSPEKLMHFEQICRQEFFGKAEFFFTSEIFLEIVPQGISKAVGVEKLVAHLGLQMEQVIAFGDYDNDAELLAKAGLGIAVENATEKVKASADLVIGSCGDDGPARFLQSLIGD